MPKKYKRFKKGRFLQSPDHTRNKQDNMNTLKFDILPPGNASLGDHVKGLLNNKDVKKVFRVGSEIYSAFQPFIDEPTWLNAAGAIFNAGKSLVDDNETWSDLYFEGNEWSTLYTRDFNQTILNVLTKFPYTVLQMSDDGMMIRLVDFDGIKVGWIFTSKNGIIDDIYIETKRTEEAKEKIKSLLWNQFKDQPLVMRYNKYGMASSRAEPKIVFEVDDAFHPLPSAKATEYSIYLKRCIAAGVPRSVMLYGPPGTGKSTMARTLIENLKLRSFRIRIDDVSNLESSTMFEAINVFKPDAIILDDLDRACSQSSLLETLEFFQRHVKLVVATINDMNQLDEALLRPGRFDELVFIDKMDEGVVKHMLGEFVDGFEDVKDWPIAFVQEYVKRRQFMSAEDAVSSTVELAQRVKLLDHYKDQNDIELMYKALKKKNVIKTGVTNQLFAENDDLNDDSEIIQDD